MRKKERLRKFLDREYRVCVDVDESLGYSNWVNVSLEDALEIMDNKIGALRDRVRKLEKRKK